jgi:hypothetical protein
LAVINCVNKYLFAKIEYTLFPWKAELHSCIILVVYCVNVRSSQFLKRYFGELECSLFIDKCGPVVNERKNGPGKLIFLTFC